MNYYINSTLRLRLFFDQPNHLAIALVMAWGVCMYLLSSRCYPQMTQMNTDSTRSMSGICVNLWNLWIKQCILSLVIAASMAGLAVTYSRSGLVAFLVVGGVLWRSRDARRWIVMSIVVMTLCFVVIPEVSGRFSSIEPFADESISHRFDVWRGTLAMSLEKPWRGFGAASFGETLTTWHLPEGLSHANTRYVTAVDAPLTFLGYWGYPVLFVYLCGWGLLLIAGFRGLWRGCKMADSRISETYQVGGSEGSGFLASLRDAVLHVMNFRWCRSASLAQPPANVCQASGLKNPLMTPFETDGNYKAITTCFIIQLSFLVGGFFTDLHQSRILSLILLASIWGTIIFHRNDSQAWRLLWRRWLPIAASASVVICGLLAAAGLWLFSEGYTLRSSPLDAQGKVAGQRWLLVPDRPNGNRLVWFIPHGSVREHARLLCRPLAKQGWEVVMLEAGEGEILKSEWAAVALEIPNYKIPNHKKISNPKYPNSKGRDGVAPAGDARFVVGGIGEEGLAALASATKLTQEEGGGCDTLVVNIESYWPFEEFNPQNTIKTKNGPLILAYELGNTHYSQAANALADMCKKDGRRIDLLPLDISEEKNLLSALRVNYFENRFADVESNAPATQD